MTKIGKIGRFLSETFFPQAYTCDICGIETFESNLCPECLKTVSFNNKETCTVCGRKTAVYGICSECQELTPLFKKAVSPLVYENGSSVLIAKFKNGSGYLKEYFADLIAEKLVDFSPIDCIVYVPMTQKAERARGYNQSKILAKSLSRRLNLPVVANALIKQKDTPEQKTLSRNEREKNLKDCFEVKKDEEISGKNILLIDDVLTTGATSEAICKLLLDAGATNVYLATVASVEFKIEKQD